MIDELLLAPCWKIYLNTILLFLVRVSFFKFFLMDSEFSTEINYYTLGEPHLHVKGSCTRDVKGAISKHVAALVVADTHNTSFQSPFFFSSRRAKWAIEAARFDRKFFFFFLEEAAFSNRVQRHRTNMMIKLSVSYVTQKCKCPFSFRRTPIWDILWFVTFFFSGAGLHGIWSRH